MRATSTISKLHKNHCFKTEELGYTKSAGLRRNRPNVGRPVRIGAAEDQLE
jgi:hypothetical protein